MRLSVREELSEKWVTNEVKCLILVCKYRRDKRKECWWYSMVSCCLELTVPFEVNVESERQCVTCLLRSNRSESWSTRLRRRAPNHGGLFKLNYSRLHIVLYNEIRSAAFDMTTCQSNLTEYGLARRRISGHGRWECDCQSHQSLHRAYRCAKQYANEYNHVSA